jgi:hypothetical protein
LQAKKAFDTKKAEEQRAEEGKAKEQKISVTIPSNQPPYILTSSLEYVFSTAFIPLHWEIMSASHS